MSHEHNHIDEPVEQQVDNLDSAGKALSDALMTSFVILKYVMIILVVFFIASGVYKVEENEKAIVLRFGKVVKNANGSSLKTSGLHFAFPEPIDEIVKIPAVGEQFLEDDSFWFYRTAEQKAGTKPLGRIPMKLSPVLNGRVHDGFCLTRDDPIEGVQGNDYNIVHSKWKMNYAIDKDPYSFFKNISVRKIKAGEVYSDVISESLAPLLTAIVDDAIVTTIVRYSIDEATTTATARLNKAVKDAVQKKLNQLDSGISVRQMNVTIIWPRQVDTAFLASIKARQISQGMVSDAWAFYEKTLNEAAGPHAKDILAELETAELSDEMFNKLAGKGRTLIDESIAYRSKVVETAEANARYLQSILPEYRKSPKLVVQKIYQDAIEEVLGNAQEKIIVQPAAEGKDREFRVLVNRDPGISKKKQDEK